MLVSIIIAIAVLAAGGGFYVSLQQGSPAPPQNLYWPNPKRIGDFSVINQDGIPFGVENMWGKWSFLFFGYTHCPDICPITLAVMTDTHKALRRQHPDIQTIFVSVDPERDTPEKLSQYLTWFDKDLIGLGGTLEMVNGLTRQLGIPYYHNKEEGAENYLVDHSASIFLIGPKGRMLAKLSPPHQKTAIIDQFVLIRNFIDVQG